MRKLVVIIKFFLKIISKFPLLTRATKYAFHKVYKNKGNFLYYEKNNLSFVLHRNETISNSIFLDDEFEFSKFLCAYKIIKKKKRTLIDIGANLGSISIPALKKNYFEKAILFEPNPESLRLLKINILINNLEEKAILNELALSNTKSSKILKSDLRFNRGDNRLISNRKILAKNHYKVKTDLLDNYTSKYSKDNCFIKIDVQGEECNILISSKKTLSKKIPIMIEFEPKNLKKNWIKYYVYIIKYYEYVYDLKEKNLSKITNNKSNLENLFKTYEKKNSFTDLLFV